MAATAAVLAARGAAEQAVELYALVHRHPYVANAVWFHDVFERIVTQAAAALAPEVVAAAQARGEATDLWQAARQFVAQQGQINEASPDSTSIAG